MPCRPTPARQVARRGAPETRAGAPRLRAWASLCVRDGWNGNRPAYRRARPRWLLLVPSAEVR